MKYITYILLNFLGTKTYVGHTKDIENRLIEHNNGNSKYTKRYKPWKVIYSEAFITEKESIVKEKYFKSSAGRRWMKSNLFSK